MGDPPANLDDRRGMMAQKATELRRQDAAVEADRAARRDRQDEFEAALAAVPAATWPEAAARARYLLELYAQSIEPHDSRRRLLVAAVLEDFARLARAIGT